MICFQILVSQDTAFGLLIFITFGIDITDYCCLLKDKNAKDVFMLPRIIHFLLLFSFLLMVFEIISENELLFLIYSEGFPLIIIISSTIPWFFHLFLKIFQIIHAIPLLFK